MNETEFRILDTLSRDIGNPITISELTREIREIYRTAHYANVYNALQKLHEEGVVNLQKAGKASLASLNLDRHHTIDLLAEVELKKKRELSGKKEEWKLFLEQVSESASQIPFPGPICMVDPERNLRLNRAELLINLPNGQTRADSIRAIRRMLQSLESMSNTRIDALILTEKNLVKFLASKEKNPIQEMLGNKLALFEPDSFWRQIRNAWVHGIPIRFERKSINPTKISEQDLIYNLARFGYKELGPEIKEGQEIAIEYITTSLLINADARRIDAIPVILSKNKADYDLLIFLSTKYGVADRLLGLLRALASIQPDKEVQGAIRTLEEMKIEASQVNRESIEQRMKLYHAA